MWAERVQGMGKYAARAWIVSDGNLAFHVGRGARRYMGWRRRIAVTRAAAGS